MPERTVHAVRSGVALFVGVVLAACGGGDSDRSTVGKSSTSIEPGGVVADIEKLTTTVDATVVRSTHIDSACSGTFVRHELDHTTRPRGEVMAMVDGTGAGVYLDDLDDDGRVDIVLPNLTGDSTVSWNDGELRFSTVPLTSGRFRQVVGADVDADGDRDLLLSTGIGPPVAMLQGDARDFERVGVRTRAITYSMAPGDLDGDGDVELVTGSYNAELTQNRDLRVLTGTDVGVAVLELDAESLTTGVPTTFLTDSAQALATLVVDIDGDGLDDVVVGNDLGTPDRVWLTSADLPGVDGLTVRELFDVTSLSTMSIDLADIDNDGDRDLVSTDMARLPGEPDSVWASVEDDIETARVDDIQQPRNAVQLAGDDTYDEAALELGVAATGWSWSGVLGDLDDDGLVDLYVVNGMQASSIFENLPDGELVQPNQAFENVGAGFELRPDWGLGSMAGGRGMAQADLDDDGDLDVVVNNLGSPSVVFENQLCGGSSVIVEPIWSGTQNLDALGASVTVAGRDAAGEPIVRSGFVTGTRGYISTGATQVHVGLGATPPSDLVVAVRWPDGEVTVIDDVDADTTLRVERASSATPPEER